jgi:hypothetical protein
VDSKRVMKSIVISLKIHVRIKVLPRDAEWIAKEL